MVEPVNGDAASPAEDWHSRQDQEFDDTLLRAAETLDDPLSTVRVYWWAGYDLFYKTHLVNVQAVRRAGESFRLLDVGCGTGTLANRLAEIFPNATVHGIDTNVASIEVARRFAPVNATFEAVSFADKADGSYDVVICSEVFEHVEQPDLLLDLLAAALVPGGHLSFSTPSGWIWRRPTPLTIYRWLLTDKSWYRRIRLRPDRNWEEALPYHPSTMPARLQRRIEARGLTVLGRSSSMWLLEGRRGLFVQGLNRLARRQPVLAARWFYYGFALMESLLNLVPPLRIFESRVVLLVRKSG